MTAADQRIDELEKLIKKHKVLYYTGKPEISDPEYDALEEELRSLAPDSMALQAVGAVPTSGKKVHHEKKMLSLGKTYKLSELESWMQNNEVISTLKIDGVSCSLIYENGDLVLAKTRGNGTIGEDITPKVWWMDSIPSSIADKKSKKIEVRGELFCTESNFFHLSEEMVSKGFDRPTSQRNIVAGLISRKENLEFCRYISFKAFEYINDDIFLKREVEKFKELTRNGFDIEEYETHKSVKSLENTIADAKNFMMNGEYQIDGLVFTYNDLFLHDELGETAHHPRYKMAFKFQGDAKSTEIKKILWSISRNGVLTPVANVEPVELSGAKVSRVTLHNYGVVKQHNLKKGDVIEIIRSGEVIPKFMSVVSCSNNTFAIPKVCPVCESETIIDDIRLYCSNKSCPGRIKEDILNFIQKIGIEEISSKRLEEMINAGLVKKISDLYKLDVEDFLKLDKVKEKLAQKFFDSIQKSKSSDLVTFLSSLGISGGAYNKCEKIVQHGFDTIEKIMDLGQKDLEEVESFAQKSANEFISSLKSKKTLIKELLKLGFEFKSVDLSDSLLGGKKFCITGALSEKRSVIERRIRDHGGVVSSSVSSTTDYLVTNETDSTSSKFKKAKSLGIPIISEQELKNLLHM